MKGILFSFWVSFFFYSACGQQLPTSKPVIDSAAINHWPSLGWSRAISNDGKYFMYSVDNNPVGSNTLIIRSTENSWQKEFVGIGTGVFSGDSKEFIFKNVDTLFFLFLGKKDKRLQDADTLIHLSQNDSAFILMNAVAQCNAWFR